MDTKLKECVETIGRMQEAQPEATCAFMGFLKAAEEGGSLEVKYKELIAVALSVSTHCEWCIAFHVKAALDAGAKPDEIKDAAMMAVVMGGGPSLMYAKHVFDAIDDFTK